MDSLLARDFEHCTSRRPTAAECISSFMLDCHRWRP